MITVLGNGVVTTTTISTTMNLTRSDMDFATMRKVNGRFFDVKVSFWKF